MNINLKFINCLLIQLIHFEQDYVGLMCGTLNYNNIQD